jgi:hypothetical protein
MFWTFYFKQKAYKDFKGQTFSFIKYTVYAHSDKAVDPINLRRLRTCTVKVYLLAIILI